MGGIGSVRCWRPLSQHTLAGSSKRMGTCSSPATPRRAAPRTALSAAMTISAGRWSGIASPLATGVAVWTTNAFRLLGKTRARAGTPARLVLRAPGRQAAGAAYASTSAANPTGTNAICLAAIRTVDAFKVCPTPVVAPTERFARSVTLDSTAMPATASFQEPGSSVIRAGGRPIAASRAVSTSIVTPPPLSLAATARVFAIRTCPRIAKASASHLPRTRAMAAYVTGAAAPTPIVETDTIASGSAPETRALDAV